MIWRARINNERPVHSCSFLHLSFFFSFFFFLFLSFSHPLFADRSSKLSSRKNARSSGEMVMRSEISIRGTPQAKFSRSVLTFKICTKLWKRIVGSPKRIFCYSCSAAYYGVYKKAKASPRSTSTPSESSHPSQSSLLELLYIGMF
jgi:hypothetical protein